MFRVGVWMDWLNSRTHKRLYTLEWGEGILSLGGTSEIAGCADRESKHLPHCLPECASLINEVGQ